MTAEDIINSLALPSESRVDQRVPKKLLVEYGAPTPADKRQINESIEELIWIAALKPTTIGVPEYRDETHEILEIAVLTLVLRADAKDNRIVELIHRAIPYPVFLIATTPDCFFLSLALKRWAEREKGKTVLEPAATGSSVVSAEIRRPYDSITESLFAGLALTLQPRANLLALYCAWIACLEAYLAARITGHLSALPDSLAQESRRQALGEHSRLEREIANLRSRAEKERQMNRRVEINLELKRLEAALARATANL